MTENTLKVVTSLSKAELESDLIWAIAEFNKEQKKSNAQLKRNDVSVVESHGISGAEIAFFLGSAVASGIAYDALKHVVVNILVPRLNKKFGAGAAKVKK